MVRYPTLQRNQLGLLAFLIAGILFRLLLVRWVPQPRIWDQEQYYGYAHGILAEGIHADTVRLYGYPLIIAPFIALFGDGFQWPLTIFQAVLDTSTGLLVYYLAKKLFHSFSPACAWLAFVLYLVNPFTSAYVGVILTEVSAIFLLTSIMYLLILLFDHWSIRKAVLTLFLLGYLPQIRPSFHYFAVVGFLFLCFLAVKRRQTIAQIAVMLLFFLLPYSYTIVTNVVRYNQFALQSVDDVFIREVYISLFIERAAAPGDTNFAWPQDVYATWWDFSSPTTPEGRREVREKYKQLAWKRISADPSSFLSSRLRKAWYIWEKHYLFPYVSEPGGITTRTLVYGGNLLLILFFTLGFLLWFVRIARRLKGEEWKRGSFVLLLILYITFAHIFSTSEERFSLPAYPFLFLFAGFALVNLSNSFMKLTRSYLKT